MLYSHSVSAELDQIIDDYIRNSSCFKAVKKDSGQIKADGISSYPLSRLVYHIAKVKGEKTFAVLATEDGARNLYQDLAKVKDIPVIYYPSSGRALYSTSQTLEGEIEQKKALEEITERKKALVILSLRSLLVPALDIKDTLSLEIIIKKGDTLDLEKTAKELAESGYTRCGNCYEMGTFSLRGEVLDIFPFTSSVPVRIYTEWDEVVKISTFDALSQQSEGELKKIAIPRLDRKDDVKYVHFDQYISASSYMCFLGMERLYSSAKAVVREAEERYKIAYREKREVNIPSKEVLSFDSLISGSRNALLVYDIVQNTYHHFSVTLSRSYFGNVKYFKEDVSALVSNDWKIFIISPSATQKERLDAIFRDMGLNIAVDKISSGFQIDALSLLVVLDNEIFGRRKQRNEKLIETSSSQLDSFVDLKSGDYVVHVNYGIGRFVKIERVKTFNTERDYIKIEYQDKEFLYVPIEQTNLVQKYIGNQGNTPRLEKLGSQSWSKKKERARKNAEELAKSLIALYAKRQASHGIAFEKDTDWQLEFEASFPFEETPDQIKCLAEIKKDMESDMIMDRLICGDVGYGKTELAFRAAFKAVMSGHQVAFLAPTVILAEQHYNTFLERLGRFPFKAALLTRFTSSAQSRRITKELKEGKIDVLFGTHKILRNISYKSLGLLVVDEEQRFGVKDKERIKEMRSNIDCLTLSATPIPRTLYMSLLKVRSMSLLTTAPRERQSIETYIQGYDVSVAVDAIKRELERAGQVFYLHNRIEDLEDIKRMLSSYLPSAIIEYAHGQMEAENLEDIMHRFIYEGVQVLVSTTIIENGINIPNVNTIIIDRADRLGLAQLYQLRGRVGRSDRKAYCYLFYPKDMDLNDDAVKRLRVMSENTALGSGFKIAMKDMEIRGAGNILGREQSGHLEAVGLDMYLKILEEEIERQMSANPEEKREVMLELEYTGYIPDSYIMDAEVKFDVYKKIASIKSEEEKDSIINELENRFGPLPEEVENLLSIAEIKVIARKLDIYHIKERSGIIEFELSRMSSVNPERLVRLIQLSGGNVMIDPRRMNFIKMRCESINLKDKAVFILEQLRRLI